MAARDRTGRGVAVDRYGCYAMPTQWIALLMVFYVASAARSSRGRACQSDTRGAGGTLVVGRARRPHEHLILPALALGSAATDSTPSSYARRCWTPSVRTTS